jgi:hypothetical protein
MDKLSPDNLKAHPWHAFQAGGTSLSGLRSRKLAEILVPLVVIAVLLMVRAFVMAGVATGITVVLWILRASSPSGRRWVDKAVGGFAHWAGHAVATLLLVPAFFVVMTWVRLMNRLSGNDPLQLRSGEAPTFWLPSDVESRRARYAKSMFCTERLTGRRIAVLPLAALALALLVGAELGLRLYGFGNPLLYQQDPDVGYFPKPNQRVRHPGRIISVNNFGMRSPDVPPVKVPGHVRILLLGDSTLAGTWVSNDELYSSLLEKKLNAAAGAPVFEVLNMGVDAWGPFHELAFVKKFGTFDADVAVICGPVYNCYRPLYGLERPEFLSADHPPRFAIDQVVYQLFLRYRSRQLGPPAWGKPGEHADAQALRGFEAYAELVRLLQQQGVEVLVEMMPSKSEMLGATRDAGTQRLVDQLMQQLAPLGVTVECAGQIFKDAKPATKVFHDQIHFDRLGHRLYADYFAGRLLQISARVRKRLEHP